MGELGGRDTTQVSGEADFRTHTEVSIEAVLAATVVEAGISGGATMDLQVGSPSVKLVQDNVAAVEEARSIERWLIQPITATVGADGHLERILLEAGIDELSSSFVRTLLGVIQFVTPPPGHREPNWTTQESDPNGLYEARYEALPGAMEGEQVTHGAYRKTKLRYLPQASASRRHDTLVPVVVFPEGGLEASFDLAAGALLTLSGTERQRFTASSREVGQARSTVSVELLSREVVPEDLLAAIRADAAARASTRLATSLWIPPDREAIDLAFAQQDLGESTLDSLLARLHRLEDGRASGDERQVYFKLKALVLVHPEECGRIARVLTAAPAESLTMSLLSQALGEVGHRPAQKALVEVIAERFDDAPVMETLIPLLGSVERPEAATVDVVRRAALESASESVAGKALLALGTMVRNLAPYDPSRASAVLDLLLDPPDPAKVLGARQWLLALGNSGQVRALPTIEGFLTSPSPELRAAAYRALRWIEADRVDYRLQQALLHDPAPEVRQAIVRSMAERKIGAPTCEALVVAFGTDQDLQVRLLALRTLWEVRDDFSAVRELVHTAAADHDRYVRDEAEVLLLMDP